MLRYGRKEARPVVDEVTSPPDSRTRCLVHYVFVRVTALQIEKARRRKGSLHQQSHRRFVIATLANIRFGRVEGRRRPRQDPHHVETHVLKSERFVRPATLLRVLD